MKKIVFVILAVFALCGTDGFSQGKYGADSAECIKYLSYYKEYFKQKSYDDALPNWRQAYKYCPPTANQTMLIDGTALIRRLIAENGANAEYKQALIDSLLTLHDLRAQYYPKYATTALNNKGLDLANYVKDSQVLFDEYCKIIETNKSQTRASIFVLNFNSALDLFREGKITAEDVLEVYQKNLSYLDGIQAKSESEEEANKKARTDMESLFISSNVASCENLIAMFTPRYEANPEDMELVTNIVKMLNMTEGCTDNELFLKAITTMHKNEPSYKSAYFLYKLNSSRDNVEEAMSYLKQAIEYPESDSMTDGEYYCELAKYCYKNSLKSEAISAANKACELNPEVKGQCYFLIGSIWGATSCGGDEIAKRAPYWVAVDYLQKAKAEDESLTEDVNSLIAQYRKYFPQTAEAFMYDLTAGQSYTVSCGGMTATTTVRTQD